MTLLTLSHINSRIPTPSTSQESSEEEYSGLWPDPKPGYTRRLISMIRIPIDQINENFDQDAWNKKVYGPDIIVVDMRAVPEGWVLVDGKKLLLGMLADG